MHITIIGAGLAGVSTANALSKRAPPDQRITLIDPKSYVEVPWASIRALFDTDIATGCTFPLVDWAVKRNITHKRALATALSANTVTLDSGETLNFDVCVISTGSTTPVPALGRPTEDLVVEERRKSMQAEGERLLSKRHVLITGGGAIGAEFAGDLAAYSRKNGTQVEVTLVHSGEHLVPEFKPPAAAKMKAQLEALDVRVVVNERAIEKNGAWVIESSSEVLDVDEVITCIGIKPCTSFLAEEGLEGCLDQKGYIKVDDHGRVVGGRGRVFAVGDCCDAGRKTGVNAMENGACVASNVKVVLSAMKDGTDVEQFTGGMKKKTDGPSVILVTCGCDGGVAQTPLGVITFFLPAVKNWTMFLFKARGAMGF